MRKIIGLIPLLLFLFPVWAPGDEPPPDALGEPAAAYDRTVVMVSLRNASPDRIRENLVLLNRNWNLFPSLQYLSLPVPESDGELLFLRGRQDEAEEAGRIAEAMDSFYPIDKKLLFVVPDGRPSYEVKKGLRRSLSLKPALKARRKTITEGPGACWPCFGGARGRIGGDNGGWRAHRMRAGLAGDLRGHNYRLLFVIREDIFIQPGIAAGPDEFLAGGITGGDYSDRGFP